MRTDRAPRTIEEVARHLGVSTRTIERAIAAGTLEALRVGRRRRITAEALDAWLAAGGKTGV